MREEGQEESCRNRRADDACHIRSHCVHQEEVGSVRLGADRLGHTRCHRDSRNTCRTDERVNLAAGDRVENLTEHHTADGREAECRKTHDDNCERLRAKEELAARRRADRKAEEDGADVAERVLRDIRKSLNHAALAEQVAEHQHAEQRCDIREKQGHKAGNEDREDNLLGLRDLSELLHLDGAPCPSSGGS